MPVDRSASQAAREELAHARRLLTQARLSASRVEQAAETHLRTSGGYSTLQITAAQAASQYHAMRRPVLENLARDREYVDLARQREVLRAEIRRVALQKKSSYEQILPLARRALAAGERMTRSESILLALDPAVEDARGAMTEAFAALRRVTMTARERALEFPGVATARQDVAQARARVAEANAHLAATLKAEAAEERARERRYARPRGA